MINRFVPVSNHHFGAQCYVIRLCLIEARAVGLAQALAGVWTQSGSAAPFRGHRPSFHGYHVFKTIQLHRICAGVEK